MPAGAARVFTTTVPKAEALAFITWYGELEIIRRPLR
jgi:hypothetical protein